MLKKKGIRYGTFFTEQYYHLNKRAFSDSFADAAEDRSHPNAAKVEVKVKVPSDHIYRHYRLSRLDIANTNSKIDWVDTEGTRFPENLGTVSCDRSERAARPQFWIPPITKILCVGL